MSDLHSTIQAKSDLITGVIATAGIPAPFWVSLLDETAKIAALVYSVFGIVWMIKQMWKDNGEKK